MYNIIVTYGQNIWDIAMQEFGSADAVFDLLLDNNIDSLNYELEPGQTLRIDEDKIPLFAPKVAEYYAQNGIKVNTGYIKEPPLVTELTIEEEGITIEGDTITIT